MGLLNKKAVEVAPEVKIEKANGCVKEQQLTFEMMIDEVETAINEREVAVAELELEVASLQAKLENKKASIEMAVAYNEADKQYVKRLEGYLVAKT
ncbi:hypothetical protein BpsS36_00038 [Bacillus phage vB_BpsS-36]|uniref:Uncharacterized protein n=1 Tax=Bacillus phage vB_BpsS-36 TaxID=2419622 RepID=A0A3G3BX16_9CAUD|nr:hypothetical protein BpsS36_00038 [Bacillus phage vB_BpsS-36]